MYDDVTGIYMSTFCWDGSGGAPYSVMVRMIIITIPVYCMLPLVVWYPILHTHPHNLLFCSTGILSTTQSRSIAQHKMIALMFMLIAVFFC